MLFYFEAVGAASLRSLAGRPFLRVRLVVCTQYVIAVHNTKSVLKLHGDTCPPTLRAWPHSSAQNDGNASISHAYLMMLVQEHHAQVHWMSFLCNEWHLWRLQSSAPYRPSHRIGDEILLVGLLDGTLHALDPSNGQQLWEYSTNDPLLSSHTQDNLVSAHADAPDFFPGVDGRLYHISEQDRSLEVCAAWAPHAAPQQVPRSATHVCMYACILQRKRGQDRSNSRLIAATGKAHPRTQQNVHIHMHALCLPALPHAKNTAQ
jgi:hypothetical protein